MDSKTILNPDFVVELSFKKHFFHFSFETLQIKLTFNQFANYSNSIHEITLLIIKWVNIYYTVFP